MTHLSGLFRSMAEMKNDEKMAITKSEQEVITTFDSKLNHVQIPELQGEHGDNGGSTAGANSNSNNGDGNGNGNGHQKKKTSSFQITRVIKPNERQTTRVSDHEIEEPEELEETNTDEVSMNSETLDVSAFDTSKTADGTVDEQPDGSYPSAHSLDDISAERSLFHPLPKTGTASLISNTIFQIPQNKSINDPSFMSLLQPISETQAQVVSQGPIPEEPSEENLKLNESRFKVVKIESELPFQRGRWSCVEYRSERDKGNGDEGVSVSGNSSAASSVYHTQDLEDTVRNAQTESFQNGDNASLPTQSQNGKHIITNSQMPTQPMPTTVPMTYPSTTVAIVAQSDTSSQPPPQLKVTNSVLSTEEGLPTTTSQPVSAVATEFTQSFTTASMPTNTTGTVTNANDFRPEREGFSNRTDFGVVETVVPHVEVNNSIDSSTDMHRKLESALKQLRMSQDYSAVPPPDFPSSVSLAQNSNPHSSQHTQHTTSDTNEAALPGDSVFQLGQPNSLDSSDRESVGSTEPEGLHKTVTPSMQLFSFVGRRDEEGGASTLAIDNKIEQAMDLVKSHLMYAVREEVEVLREQIRELLDKNNQLERENSILRQNATPEALVKVQQARQQQQVSGQQPQQPGGAQAQQQQQVPVTSS